MMAKQLMNVLHEQQSAIFPVASALGSHSIIEIGNNWLFITVNQPNSVKFETKKWDFFPLYSGHPEFVPRITPCSGVTERETTNYNIDLPATIRSETSVYFNNSMTAVMTRQLLRLQSTHNLQLPAPMTYPCNEPPRMSALRPTRVLINRDIKVLNWKLIRPLFTAISVYAILEFPQVLFNGFPQLLFLNRCDSVHILDQRTSQSIRKFPSHETHFNLPHIVSCFLPWREYWFDSEISEQVCFEAHRMCLCFMCSNKQYFI